MIKLVRILTFLFAVVIMVFSIFYVDAEHELATAKLAYKSGDMDQALRKGRRANRAFSDKDKKASAFYVQAKAASKMDWTEKSKDYLDKLLELKPEHLSGLLLRGEIHILLGNNQNALVDMNKGIELASGKVSNNSLAFALSKRGLAFLALNQVAEAEKDAIKAVTISSNLPQAYDLLSRVMEQKGEYKKAVDACEKAYKLLTENDRYAVVSPEGRMLSDRLVDVKVKYLQSKK